MEDIPRGSVVDGLHVIMMSYCGTVPSPVYQRWTISQVHILDGVVQVFQLDWRLSCCIVYVSCSQTCVAIVCPAS